MSQRRLWATCKQSTNGNECQTNNLKKSINTGSKDMLLDLDSSMCAELLDHP